MPLTYATWNPADKSGGTLSAGDLSWTLAAGGFTTQGVRGTLGLSTGKRYFELTVDQSPGSAFYMAVGLVDAALALNTSFSSTSGAGTGRHVYDSGASQNYTNTVVSSYGGAWSTVGKVIGVAADLDAHTLEFFIDGVSQGVADTGLTGTLFPFLNANTNVGSTQQATANFGASAWAHAPPAGFSGWSSGTLLDVRRQFSLPWSVLADARRQFSLPWDLAGPVARQFSLPWRLSLPTVARQFSLPWALGLPVARQWTLPWAANSVARQWTVPISWRVERQFALPFALRAEVRRQFALPWTSTVTVARQFSLPFSLPALNRVARQFVCGWALPVGTARQVSQAVTASAGGLPLRLADVQLVGSGSAPVWTLQAEIARLADFYRLAEGDALSVSLDGEVYALVVSSLTLDRTGPAGPRMVVRAASPASALARPLASLLTQAWEVATGARAVVESVLGQSVDWQIGDWMIPAGRLSVTEAAPMDVARLVAGAAGAVVLSLPDGSLRVQYAFPVRVPDWATVTPDQVLTDVDDNLSLSVGARDRAVFDQVAVRDVSASGGGMTAALDDRADGPNQGRTSFAPGDPAHVLVHKRAGVAVSAALASSGQLVATGTQGHERVEDVFFRGQASAQLSLPATGVVSVLWLGASLGTLSLDADQVTLRAASAGVAVARVRYALAPEGYSIQGPDQVAGLTEYPLALHWDADSPGVAGQVHVIARRGDGTRPAPDVVEPLLGDPNVALARGRNELDRHSGLQTLRLTCVYRAGVLPGQVVEVHDALAGPSWRGMVRRVQHRRQGPALLTTLEVARA